MFPSSNKHAWVMLCFLALISLLWLPSAQAAYTISGTVFRDYNANGVRDANEPPISGVTVMAYNANGAVAANSSSSTAGAYLLTIASDEKVRVEFTPSATYEFAGAAGSNNESSVVFVSSARSDLNYGISIPGDYCQQNPDLATNCYIPGDQAGVTTATLLRTPYQVINPYNLTPTVNDLAQAATIGTTWGLGYQASSDKLFSAAFLKRHTGFGPAGTGAIYVTNGASGAAPQSSLFLNLDSLLGNGIAGADPRAAGGDYQFDRESFPLIGKVALGDLDVSPDDQTIWTVNLATRELYRIPIGLSGVAPTNAAAIGRYAIPTNGCTDAGNARPFALGFNLGVGYLGMVCSGEFDTADFKALIYSFNLQTGAISAAPVVSFPLTYPRGCVDFDPQNPVCPANFDAEWHPWVSTLDFSSIDLNGYLVYPQPMLTDIVFDNGAMVLGFRDRFGDQSGLESFSPISTDEANYNGFAAGDILRLCPDTTGAWVLENNATCGGVGPTAGVGTGQGPGNGEFYHGDNHPNHDEIPLGGLAQKAGAPELASTVFDPIPDPTHTFESGITWLNNSTGAKSSGALLRSQAQNPFGKANGMGDLEALCNAAPVEIGNRVWLDTNKDGVQGADETPIAGVSVELVNDQGTVIATAVTDSNGHYYFSNDKTRTSTTSSIYNITGLVAGGTYTVRIPLNQAALDNTYVTLQKNDAGTNGTARDSDGDNANAAAGTGKTGYTQVSFSVTGVGHNNHTYDFGFITSPTAIVLSRFTATLQEKSILLTWETALEANTFGFELLRSASGQRADAVAISAVIPAQNRSQGASYSWQDKDNNPKNVYWLVEIETDGRRTEYGPFRVQPNTAGAYMIMLPYVGR